MVFSYSTQWIEQVWILILFNREGRPYQGFQQTLSP